MILVHRLGSAWDDFRSEWTASVGESMASFCQRLQRHGDLLLFDQYVVGVESGDGEYGYAAFGQGIEKRGQHSCQRKREWAFQLEAGPRRLTFCLWWRLSDGAND